jgi:ornithine cyclodeaminase/alanine dehydrogenase-like protein (mu-crystallin family)
MADAERKDATPLRLLSTDDVAQVDISLDNVLSVVEEAYRTLAAGESENPRKLTVKSPDGASVAYAMLGRDGARRVVAVKTSYKRDPQHDRNSQRYYTSLLLYDDDTGLPVALMDCARIGALRTPAVSALLARECARPGSRRALVIGTGTQGRLALPFLLSTLPQLEELMLYGTHADGIRAVEEELRRRHPERTLHVVNDLPAACAEADVVLAVAGPATPARVESSWLKPGTLTVLVGYGLAPSTLHDADYVVATSAAQMAVTGTDLTGRSGQLRAVDAELPAILAGRACGRSGPDERVFAYNSGLVITDIALGHRVAEQAAAQQLGRMVSLWC